MSDDDLIRRGDALKLMQLAIDVYDQNMRGAADKKEKRDWQSMLIAAVDIRYAIKAIPAVQVTAYSENGVAALVEALVEQNDLLRSAFEIAKREGVNGEVASTNWDAYYNRVAVTLKRHHQTTNDARAALARVKGGEA